MNEEVKDQDPDMALLEEHVRRLGEHFDTVQIFVTRVNDASKDKNTFTVESGAGNFCARLGQVIEWIERNMERNRIDARRDEADE